MKLSIIIPIFNEEKTVGEILRRVFLVKLPSNIKKEIIVIDDGSTDKTFQVLSEFKIQNVFQTAFGRTKFKILRHEENKGKGAAIRTGIKRTTGDVVIIQDADLEYDPKFYTKLLEPILKKNAQVVYGSRLINYPLKFWGRDKTVLPLHFFANKLLTFLTNLIYRGDLTDMETGYKLFKKTVLKNIVLNSNKFDFEAEVTAKILKRGIGITEVPIQVIPRTYKEGKKIGWKDGILAIRTLIRYRLSD